jgi:tetratricopeptide (TPR) repeat protein
MLEQARDLAERLEVDAPTDAVRSVLAGSHNNIGWVLYLTGKSVEALAAHQKSLAIQQKLADANPSVTEFQVALSNSHNNIGRLLSDTGRPAEALEAHGQALAILQKLAEANPADATIQMHLAGTYNHFGLVLSQTEKPQGALEAQRKALAIRQRLAEASPAVTQYQNDLAWCYDQIGDLLLRTGKPAEALEAYGKALPIWRKLDDANPDNKMLVEVAQSYYSIGRAHASEKRFAEAFTSLDTALTILRKLVEGDPGNTRYAGDLAQSYAYCGGVRVRAGQPAEAATYLRQALELWAKDPAPAHSDTRFERSRALALLAGLGGVANSDVTKDEAAAFADQAVAALREAFSGGWGWTNELKEPDFDAIRSRDDFKKLMAELEAKAGPKAKPKN